MSSGPYTYRIQNTKLPSWFFTERGLFIGNPEFSQWGPLCNWNKFYLFISDCYWRVTLARYKTMNARAALFWQKFAWQTSAYEHSLDPNSRVRLTRVVLRRNVCDKFCDTNFFLVASIADIMEMEPHKYSCGSFKNSWIHSSWNIRFVRGLSSHLHRFLPSIFLFFPPEIIIATPGPKLSHDLRNFSGVLAIFTKEKDRKMQKRRITNDKKKWRKKIENSSVQSL